MKGLFFLIALLLIVLSACSSTDDQDETAPPDYNQTTQSVVVTDDGENSGNSGDHDEPGTVAERFQGFKTAQSSGAVYNINRIFEVSGRFAYDENSVYYSDCYDDYRLYKITNGAKELLVDSETRNLTVVGDELYYLKKTADDVIEGSEMFLGDVYSLNLETMTEKLIINEDVREFTVTENGLLYATPDSLILADLNGEKISQILDRLQGVSVYGDYIFIYDNATEDYVFKNINNNETIPFGKLYSISFIWENSLFILGNENLLEVDLITGEMYPYPQKRIVYMTYSDGNVYATDMTDIYRLDREKHDYVELEVNRDNFSAFSVYNLFSSGKKLYAEINYSLKSDLFTAYTKLAEIAINGDKGEVILID